MSKFQSLDCRFENSQGTTLAARLELPENPDYFAIFSPCFTCTKETLATSRISRLLAKHNIAILRLDFTGLGQSEGDFGDSNFSTMIDDIHSAQKYLSQHYQAAKLLIGHSMGGTASYASAPSLKDIKAVCSIASPSSPEHVLHHFGDALEHIKSGKTSEFSVAGTQYPIRPQFLNDLSKHKFDDCLSSLDAATLIFHAENDTLVDIEHAHRLFALTQHPKSFISLDTADHILSDRNDARYVADLIYAWCKRYTD